MRILFTNNALGELAGTERYTRDVALAMKSRGHECAVFTLAPGVVAAALQEAGVPVVNDLRELGEGFVPDVIHGHHLFETSLAAMSFPRTPVLSFCHGPVAWQEAPCRLPNVAGWIAVDETCRKRLVEGEGIPAERVNLLLNFVDTEVFRERPEPLPPRPARALVFSNTMADCEALRVVEKACEKRGIELEVAGNKAGTATTSPEQLLPRYDLVFAKAKAAIEAMASG